MAFVNL